MTEHERRVNNNDINAFQEEKKEIFGKLPGFGGRREAEVQQKILDNALGRRSPASFSRKADVYIES
jgi:hypothetical protein